MTREELVDELSDAITDTLDMDWNSHIGARMQRALDFIVGGDPHCVKARGALLKLEANVRGKHYMKTDAERALEMVIR